MAGQDIGRSRIFTDDEEVPTDQPSSDHVRAQITGLLGEIDDAEKAAVKAELERSQVFSAVHAKIDAAHLSVNGLMEEVGVKFRATEKAMEEFNNRSQELQMAWSTMSVRFSQIDTELTAFKKDIEVARAECADVVNDSSVRKVRANKEVKAFFI